MNFKTIFKSGSFWLVVFAIVSVGIAFIRNGIESKYSSIFYFYACNNNEANCYKVTADFAEPECLRVKKFLAPDDVTCKDPLPNKIYFNEGVSILLSCVKNGKEQGKEKWYCKDIVTEKVWSLKFYEEVKYKK